MNDFDKLVRIGEAADLLGVRVSWLYDQVRRNALPVVRLGRQLRFSRADLVAYAASRRTDPPPPAEPVNGFETHGRDI